MQSLNELEGKTLAGTFPLMRLLRTEVNNAWFATQYQNKSATAFVAIQSPSEDQLVASLEAVSKIKHPNVVAIERVGRAKIDGSSIVYAIEESMDENLGEVLRDRPLTTDETSQIIDSLVGGLTVLHQQGLLHGHISAANIFAIGDTVKLRSDCVQKLSAAEKSNPEVYGQDTGDMGALVFECLTQRQLTVPDDPAIAKLPAPFNAIVQNAVTGKWGLANIAAALKKTSTPPNHPVPAAGEKPKASAKAPAAEVARKPSSKNIDVPPIAAVPLATPLAASLEDGQPKKGTWVRVLAILAIVAALGIFYYFYRTSSAPHPETPAAVVQPDNAPQNPTPATGAANTPPTAGDTTAATPSASSSASTEPAPPAPTPAAPEGSSGKHKIWRVVVYTYGRESEAQQKAAAMLAQHPDLKPEAFSPNGHGPYLVTVGGPMEKKDAFRFRAKAVAEGLPADSYAQNYTH